MAERIDADVPEVAAAVSQPIRDRTNELIAGVRSDVVVLIYGRELDELNKLGKRVATVLKAIPGATDVRVEQTAGLEYLRIRPDRGKLARYGLAVQDVNQLA